MGATPIHRFSAEEYLRFDETAERKSEFHDGEISPIVDVSDAHSTIAFNFVLAIGSRLKSGCAGKVTGRVRIDASRYVYPDALVVCGATQFVNDAIANPRTVIEVLSPSTEDYDRGGKLKLYQSLPSFEEYVLIAQDQPRVDVFRKQAPGQWSLQIIEGLDQTVQQSVADAPFSLGELYRGITFEALT